MIECVLVTPLCSIFRFAMKSYFILQYLSAVMLSSLYDAPHRWQPIIVDAGYEYYMCVAKVTSRAT
jgi:hypothetical protein